MIRTWWFVAVGTTSTVFFSLAAVSGGLLGAGRGFFDWVHRSWAGILLRSAGVRVRTKGLEHVEVGGAQILVANHQSAFDIWALMRKTPASLRFVAKQELSRVPIFARACRSAGHVFIDRNDRQAAMAAIRAAGDRMRREGLSLVLFPEGTRSADGRLGRFKRGSFVLAIETRAPLVPVAIQGGAQIQPKGSRRVHPGVLLVRFGEPIQTRGLTAADRDALTERCRVAVEEMLEGLPGPEPSDGAEGPCPGVPVRTE